ALAMVEGRELWAAVKDGSIVPFTLSDVGELRQETKRVITNVTRVHCMTVVPPIKEGKVAEGASVTSCTRAPGDSAEVRTSPMTLWCGLEDGRISVCDSHLAKEQTVIPNAHNESVTFLYTGPNGWV